MRIAELSGASGVPIPTIKYYIREGLLPPGKPQARNQAAYGDDHLRRLRLIRVLVDVGGLEISAIREVAAAIEDEDLPLHSVFGMVQRAITPAPVDVPADEQRETNAFVDSLGWQVSPEAPTRVALAQALAALRALGWHVPVEVFAPYAAAVADLAALEVGSLQPVSSRSEAVEGLVIGTIVFEAALTNLRRMAHEHHSAARFRQEQQGTGEERRDDR